MKRRVLKMLPPVCACLHFGNLKVYFRVVVFEHLFQQSQPFIGPRGDTASAWNKIKRTQDANRPYMTMHRLIHTDKFLMR